MRAILTPLLTALVTALPAVVSGQTSLYATMSLTGDFVGWNPTVNNMTLVSNNTWRIDVFRRGESSDQAKFAANGSYDVNWGTGTPVTAPTTNTISTTGNGPDINITYPYDGFYRFTFNDSSGQFTIDLLGHNQTPINLLRNGSFEVPGSDDTHPAHWQFGFPDVYGDHWGNSGRADWRSVQGDHLAYIGSGSFGGFWQEAPAARGLEYEFSIQTWADVDPPYGPWTATVAGVKLEFFDEDRQILLEDTFAPFNELGQSWTTNRVRATAPADAAYVRAVVFADGVGPLGSLQLDVASLKETAPARQTFDVWPEAETFSDSAYAGWAVYNGRVTLANAFSGRAAQLSHTSTVSAIISPYLPNGLQRLTFRYRNASNTQPEENLPPAGFTIETSSGSLNNWSDPVSVGNIRALAYETYGIDFDDPSIRYVRIRISSLKNGDDLMIDEVELIGSDGASSRFQDFEAWTTPGDGCHETNQWLLCTGRVDNDRAILAASETATNGLRSPLYQAGFGRVSFRYAQGTNGGGAAVMALQSSPDGVDWSTFHYVSNIVGTALRTFDQTFYQPDPAYLRIVNVPGVYASSATLLIDEPFDEGKDNLPSGWTANGVGEYTSEYSSGDTPESILFGETGDWLQISGLSNPTGLQFWARGNSAAGSTLIIEADYGGSTSVVRTLGSSGSEQTYTIGLTGSVEAIRFTFNEDSGNVAFDDVKIWGGGGSASDPQQLVLDDISIGSPQPTYLQTFNDWPEKTSFTEGTDSFQGWSVRNATVTDNNAYDGQSARLGTGGWVDTHYLPDGLGSLSFRHRLAAGGVANLQVAISTNGISYSILISNLTVNTTTWQESLTFHGIEAGCWIRLLNASPNEVIVDNIDIRRAADPASVILTSETIPPAPTSNDTVQILVNVRPRYGAVITSVTGEYRIGTNGAFTTLSLTNSGFNEYLSQTFPAYPAGTRVEYRITAAYTGPGASSPEVYESFYGIPRATPGQVWINEMKYYGPAGNGSDEFIELVGPAGFDLGGWTIQILGTYGLSLNSPPNVREVHNIPNPTLIPDDTSGLGFYVLGGANVLNRDANLQTTNTMSQSLPLGIRLLNEAGGIEQALAFDGTILEFENTQTADNPFEQDSVHLEGTGTTYAAFTWVDPEFIDEDSPTPGAPNTNQSFPGGTDPVPEAWVMELGMGANVTLRVTGNVDAWDVQPKVTESLMGSGGWTDVVGFGNTFDQGTNTITFGFPAGYTSPVFAVEFVRP